MIDLVITDAGLDALVDAQNGATSTIAIIEIGLTETAFDAAPTIETVPGEFKRIAAAAGQLIADNIIHLTAQDSAAEAYDLRGIGLYLSDGTLFATYGQPDPLFSKVSTALFLMAVNARFSASVAGAIEIGDATFVNPPATETVRGIAELATQAETDAGQDDERSVTPLKLARHLAPILQSVIDEATARGDEDANIHDLINALEANTVTAAGLAIGGGEISDNPTINVAAASGAEIAAGNVANKAITPAGLKAMPQTWNSVSGLGGAIIKHGTVSVGFPSGGSHSFPVSFPSSCDRVVLTPLGDTDTGGDEKDEHWWISSMSASGFSVSTSGDGSATSFAFIAIGH